MQKTNEMQRPSKLLKLRRLICPGGYTNSNNCSPQQAELPERVFREYQRYSFPKCWGGAFHNSPSSPTPLSNLSPCLYKSNKH